MPPHTNHIHKLLTDGDILPAIKELLAKNLDNDSKNTVLLLSERHTHNEEENRLGTIDRKDYLLERNKIVAALLAICDKTPLPKKALTNAPLKPDSHFIGRETELAEIRTRFEANEMLMLVNGEGGIGKTTLVSKYWHDYEQDYTHLAYVFCEGDIRDDIRNKLALPLGIDIQQVAEEKLTAKIVETMAAYPKPCLLILDNANESRHIIDFRDTFSEIGWHILITSRCQKVLPKEQEIAIHHLPPAQAKVLFLQHYTENSPNFDSLLDKLLLAVGYNTLCVEIFAKTLRELCPTEYTLVDFLKDFANNGLYLGDKSFEIHTQYTDYIHKKAATSDDILNVLYDLSRLNETEQLLLTRFALLPPENHIVKHLIAIFKPENKFNFTKELIILAQKGWLNTNTDTYRLSPVIQQLLFHKYQENLWKAGKLLVNSLINILKGDGTFLAIPLHEALPFIIFADFLIENIKVETFEIGLLSIYLSDYYRNISNLNKSIVIIQKAKNIFSIINEEHNYCICLERIGKIYEIQGNINKAIIYFKECKELCEKRYKENPNSKDIKSQLAISYQKLANIYQMQGDFKKAIFLLEKDAKLMKILFNKNPNDKIIKKNLAISYQTLGNIYILQGNFEKAISFFNLNVQLIEELYQVEINSESLKENLATAYGVIGKAYKTNWDLGKAYYYFLKAHKLKEELFIKNPTVETIKKGLAISYIDIGYIEMIKKNLEKALSYLKKANQLAKELHKLNPTSIDLSNGLAVTYNILGCLYQAMNQLSIAKEHFMAAEKIWRELVERVPDYVVFMENWENVKRDLEGLG